MHKPHSGSLCCVPRLLARSWPVFEFSVSSTVLCAYPFERGNYSRVPHLKRKAYLVYLVYLVPESVLEQTSQVVSRREREHLVKGFLLLLVSASAVAVFPTFSVVIFSF